MPYDESTKRIVAPPADSLPYLEQARQRQAAIYKLTAVPASAPLIQATLVDGEARFLNNGEFSRVYVIDDTRVLKFCHDLQSLQILERLGAQSRFFPRVDVVLEDQARDGEQIYHAAVIERLQEGYPVWMRSIIDGYRRPFRADSPIFASGRLLQVRSSILAGGIVVPPEDMLELAAAMRLLAAECLNGGCLDDLRTEVNIMLRPCGQAVIADPTNPILPNY
jgi:hypothetical protein